MATQASQEPPRTLSEFAVTLRYDDLPERSREHRKNLILDALACAVTGHQDETPAKSWHWHRLSREETHRSSRAKHAG